MSLLCHVYLIHSHKSLDSQKMKAKAVWSTTNTQTPAAQAWERVALWSCEVLWSLLSSGECSQSQHSTHWAVMSLLVVWCSETVVLLYQMTKHAPEVNDHTRGSMKPQVAWISTLTGELRKNTTLMPKWSWLCFILLGDFFWYDTLLNLKL